MMQFVTGVDFIPIIPEVILLITAILALLVELYGEGKEKLSAIGVLTIVGLVCAIIAETQLYGKDTTGFFGTIVADEFSILFEHHSITFLTDLLTVLLTHLLSQF